MSTNSRRRERYRTDPEFRQACIDRAVERKRKLSAERAKEDRLRGWIDISSAPENEVVKLYDPEIFWPVLAEMDPRTHEWVGVHYEGRINPTHWKPMDRIPLT